MFCHDFIKNFTAQYPDFSWEDIEKSLHKMTKEIFIGATKYDYPKGIPHNNQCKGSYGLDVMLDWSTDNKGKFNC